MYTPPLGNAVAFNFTDGYTPPAGNAVAFDFGQALLEMETGRFFLLFQ